MMIRQFLKGTTATWSLWSVMVAISVLISGCSFLVRPPRVVVQNERMGYTKVLSRSGARQFLQAVALAKVVPNKRSFNDFCGEGYWGGEMYEVSVEVKDGVCIGRYVFDSGAALFEDHGCDPVVMRECDWEQGSTIYRLLSPWATEEEEREATFESETNLNWGLFPKK
jgi:hypothetical protein